MKRICNFVVIFMGWSLAQSALGFQPPGLDKQADRQTHLIQASGTLELAFTPGDKADRIIIDSIQSARKQVLVQSFSFTHKGIALALVAAHQRGIDVQLISDEAQIERMERSQIPALADAGLHVFVDAAHDSAHNKIMLIDPQSAGAIVMTGSFNFTHAAQYRNAENLLVFRGNPALVQAFLDNWKRHRAHAHPFVQSKKQEK